MRLHFTVLLTFLLASAQAQKAPVTASKHYYLLVGTYDSPESNGIYVYDFNSADGSAKKISETPVSNPSFLCVSPDNKFVYAVTENADSITHKGGGVRSFSFDKKKGELNLLSKQSSEGDHPCYISTDKSGKWVLAGNYSSGNFSVLPTGKNGVLGKARTVIQHSGSGPDSSRQQSAHVHAVYFKKGTNELYVPDLGMDKVMSYRLNPSTGAITPAPGGHITVDAGTGPRHIDFHPNGKYAYLMQELTGSVVVYKTKPGGGLEEIQSNSALPYTYRGPQGGGADIHVSPDGKFLYCSIRGLCNTIAVFSINQQTGMITMVESVYTEGEKPRNFNFDPTGNFLLVGNQNSDEIVIFKRDKSTGKLSDSGQRIKVGKPVCIKWIPMK
jgi:6-phosphogluconolactonase